MARAVRRRSGVAKSRGANSGAAPDAGHATHFLERLEERLGGEAEELALALYHRPAALRAMMPRLSIPEGIERVALALAPGGEGPWVVVTKEGSFVTCLARGMALDDLYEVSNERLVAHRQRFLETRQRMDSARELAPESTHPFQTLLDRALLGPISREEFRALEATAGLLGRELFKQFVADLRRSKELYERLDRRPVDRRRDERRLRELWTLHHRTCNLLLLLSGSHFTPTLSVMAEALPTLFEMFPIVARPREVGLLLRLAHFIGRHGKLALASCKKHFQDPIVPSELLFGLCGIVAIGARTSKTRGELRKLLMRLPQLTRGWSPGVGGLPRELFHDKTLYTYVLTCVSPEDVLPTFNSELAASFEEHLEELAEGGELASQLHVERAEDVDRSAAFATFAWPERVAPVVGVEGERLDEARNVWDTFSLMLPQAIVGDASDFFLPHAHLPPPERRHLAASARQLDVASELVAGVAGQMSHQRRERVLKVGRNAPCPCGSGIKFKRCCAGKERQLLEEQLARLESVSAEQRATEVTLAEHLGLPTRLSP